MDWSKVVNDIMPLIKILVIIAAFNSINNFMCNLSRIPWVMKDIQEFKKETAERKVEELKVELLARSVEQGKQVTIRKLYDDTYEVKFPD